MNVVLCEAIRRRSVLEFAYDGSRRTVEPHTHGISTADNEVLRAYQTAGFSQSGTPVGWKLFEVGKISGLRETGATFAATRPDYQPDDSHMSHVHCYA